MRVFVVKFLAGRVSILLPQKEGATKKAARIAPGGLPVSKL